MSFHVVMEQPDKCSELTWASKLVHNDPQAKASQLTVSKALVKSMNTALGCLL